MYQPSRFRAGAVYFIADRNVRLPGDEQGRNVHTQRRPVLIVSDQNEVHGTNAQPGNDWPSVLVVPISSSTGYRTKFDVPIAAGEGNLSKKGWARVPALQMVDKDYLVEWIGQVRQEVLDQVTAQILNYMGLIQPEPPEADDGLAFDDIPF